MKHVVALLLACFAGTASAADVTPQQTLELIKEWVQGAYDSNSQAKADLADASIPDDRKHRAMYQLFAPVEVEIPAIPGYLVFQQASADGSYAPGTIMRVGLLQYFVDEKAGVVRQRELNFRDIEPWKNAHLEPERLSGLTLEAFDTDPACDFHLLANAAGTEVYGPIKAGACRFFSESAGKEFIADDAVWIRPNEYGFLGRFVDAAGAVMWGNASDLPTVMVRTGRVAGRVAGGVLVFGATRGTGLELARALRAQGQAVTAFVRPQSDRSGLDGLGVAIVEGDALDAATVRAAFAAGRYSAVVSTLGCRGCDPPPDFIGNRNVIDAAVAAGVGRFVLISTVGAGDSAEAPPWIAKWFLREVTALKTQAEEHLRASGLDFTIIRPGGLKNAEPTGRGQLSTDRAAMGIITRADVAALIAGTLNDPGTIGQTYAALDPGMSWPWDMF